MLPASSKTSEKEFAGGEAKSGPATELQRIQDIAPPLQFFENEDADNREHGDDNKSHHRSGGRIVRVRQERI